MANRTALERPHGRLGRESGRRAGSQGPRNRGSPGPAQEAGRLKRPLKLSSLRGLRYLDIEYQQRDCNSQNAVAECLDAPVSFSSLPNSPRFDIAALYKAEWYP